MYPSELPFSRRRGKLLWNEIFPARVADLGYFSIRNIVGYGSMAGILGPQFFPGQVSRVDSLSASPVCARRRNRAREPRYFLGVEHVAGRNELRCQPDLSRFSAM